jgi:hypothetical protein
MQVNHREAKRKQSFISPNTPRAVYDGQDRLGAYRQRDDDLFVAVDRRGRELGLFNTASEAIAAIAMTIAEVTA